MGFWTVPSCIFLSNNYSRQDRTGRDSDNCKMRKY